MRNRTVPRGPLTQRDALADPEAVLLVHDHQPKLRKLEPVLDQRLGTDENVQRAASGVSVGARAVFALHAAGEQTKRRLPTKRVLELRAGAPEQSAQSRKVLLGQNLRGCHERTLQTVGERIEQRQCGHRGFARTNLALQQPRHWSLEGHVAQDLVSYATLRGGQLERKSANQSVQHMALTG